MKSLRTPYFIFANSVILFLLVVTATHFALIAARFLLDARSPYGMLSAVVKRNYSHMMPADVDELIRATNKMAFQYAPGVGMREKPTKSRFVNVSDYGRRSNGKAPEDISEIQNAIWFFGGSTTFGYGVADEETIPAQLEKLLGRSVMNFGVGGFNSERENLALVQYLRLGFRPSMVIFLDGVNESCGLDDYELELYRLFDLVQEGYRWDLLEIAKPVTYAFGKLSIKLRKPAGFNVDKPAGNALVCEQYGKRQALREVHAQILAERGSLCSLYALRCKTLVQPFGGVHGRYDDPAFLEKDRTLKRELFMHLEGNWRKAGAEFITDALDRYKRHAYLDEEHYGAAACKIIAEAITARFADQRK